MQVQNRMHGIAIARRDARSPVVNDLTGFAGPGGRESPLSIDVRFLEQF